MGTKKFKVKSFLLIFSVFVFLLAFPNQVFPKSLYVLNMQGYMEAFDIQNSALIHQTQTAILNGSNAVGLALDEDSQYLFVTYESANYINTFDANTMSYITQVTPPSASNLAGIVVDQRTHRVYAVNRGSNRLFVYLWNGANHTLTNLITSGTNSLELKNTSGGTISGTYGLTIDEENDRLYVGYSANGIMGYDIDDLINANQATGITAVSNIPTSPTHNAIDVAIDVDDQVIYCTSAYPNGGDFLYKYNVNTGSAMDNVDLGDYCIGVAVDQGSSLVYVTTYSSGSLKVYNPSLALQNTYMSGQRPTGLVVPTSGSVSYNPLNLSITAPSVVGQGGNIYYSLSYSNQNSTEVTNVTLVGWVPSNTTYSSCSAGGVYDSVSGTITWDIGTLAGNSPTASKSFTVIAPSSPGEEISMTARINAPDTGWTQVTQEASTETSSGNAPAIANVGGTVTYTAGGSLGIIDDGGDAVVTDTDDTHMNGGFLLVDYLTSFIATDQLTIADFGLITIVGNEVRYNGNAIGDIDTTNSGVNGNNLKVNFDSDNATLEAVGALIHALRFSNSTVPVGNTPTTQRNVDITVSDPGGNSSPASTVNINVNTDTSPTALPATNISLTGFTANWQLPATGSPDSYRLDVSEFNDFSSYVTGYQDKTVSGLSDIVTGLNSATTYYYRVRAVEGVVTSGNSNTISATTSTPLAAPTVTTTSASSITGSTAVSGGDVTADGGAFVTSRGVCWSISANPTIADASTSDGSGTGSFVSSLTGLLPGTTYNVRAYATNSVGTSYGNEITFTTDSATVPVVETAVVTGISLISANSGGNVTSDGGASVTSRGVCWSISANPTTFNSHTSNGTGTGTFNSNITGLTPDTTYHVRAYATNSVGTSYGESETFTTVAILPTIEIINPAGGSSVSGIVTVTADSSVLGFPVEFFIDDVLLGAGDLVEVDNNSVDNSIPTIFNIDDSSYLFIDENRQLKKISKENEIENVFNIELNVNDIFLNRFGEVFIDLTDGIRLDDNNIYRSIMIDVTNKTVTGFNTGEYDNILNRPSEYSENEILQSMTDRFDFDQRVLNSFEIDENEDIVIGYKDTTANYSIISALKSDSGNDYKTLAFSRVKPIKIARNLISIPYKSGFPIASNNPARGNELTSTGNLYNIKWDTSGYSDGIHKISVEAKDEYARYFSHEIEVHIGNFKIDLSAVRKEDTALTFKIYFGELTFSIANPSGLEVEKYVIYRSIGGNEFAQIMEVEESELVDNKYTFTDMNLSSDDSYTYKVVAYDGLGNVLSVSEEKTI